MSQMLKIKVTNEIEFAYHDSGAPPNKSEYKAIILIHGHTYHSGTFKVMLQRANEFGFRIILPNRRLYPGSTPLTKEEVDAVQPGKPVGELADAYMKHGEHLLMFVNNVIKEHNLGSVILSGWSLGTGFLSVTVASIVNLSEEIQANLRKTVKTIVWWDPSAGVIGINDPPTGGWTPLYDETLTPEERGQAFGQWLSQYFPHKDVDKRDCHNFIYKITSPTKTPTFTGMPFEEFLTMVDFTAGVNGDSNFGDRHFLPVNIIIRDRAFFDSKVRAAWGNIPFNVIYGEESPYNVLWAAWQLDEIAKQRGMPLATKGMPGSNHFAMHDQTKLVFDTLKEF